MNKILNKKYFITVVLLLTFCIPAIFPLLQSGFFVTDDGEWMIIRFSAFYQAFADGQFPVRFLHRLNFDFGYPVATFLYPGFMYAAVPLHILKIGFVETIKKIIGISLVGTTVFTYLWLSILFQKKLPSFIGALVSLYVPYHLYDLYTRGSVGELFAILWIPFILWMIEKKNFFFLSIGIFLLLISHNTIALLFLPLLFLYAILRKVFSFKQLLIYFSLGVLLSAFFIIPAIFELSLTRFSQTIISDPKNYFADVSLIGISTFIIFIIAGALFVFKKKSHDIHDSIIRLFLLVTFFAAFLSSSWSGFVWQFIPSSFIQFPFRILSFLIISVAFLTAFIVSEITSKVKRSIVIVGILLLLIISSFQYGYPPEFVFKGEGFYTTNEATTTVQDEYLPVWVKEKPIQRAEQKAEIIDGEAEIKNISYNNKEIKFDVNSKTNTTIGVNTIYWPGWKVFIDNKETTISNSNTRGIIEVAVPKGSHEVRAIFGETQLRLVADIISVLSFIVLIYITKFAKKKNK